MAGSHWAKCNHTILKYNTFCRQSFTQSEKHVNAVIHALLKHSMQVRSEPCNGTSFMFILAHAMPKRNLNFIISTEVTLKWHYGTSTGLVFSHPCELTLYIAYIALHNSIPNVGRLPQLATHVGPQENWISNISRRVHPRPATALSMQFPAGWHCSTHTTHNDAINLKASNSRQMEIKGDKTAPQPAFHNRVRPCLLAEKWTANDSVVSNSGSTRPRMLSHPLPLVRQSDHQREWAW